MRLLALPLQRIKTIDHTKGYGIAICIAVHIKDVVPLPITFAAWKFCENFTYEDNFNNTFLLKKYHSLQTALQPYGKARAKVVKGS